MAETTNASINHFFGMDSISKTAKTTQRLKGLRLRPKIVHPSAASSSGLPPTGASSRKTSKCSVKKLQASRGGDRFIPNRSVNNMEQGSFLLSGKADHLSPGTQEYQDFLLANVTAENPQKKVLNLTVGEVKPKNTSMIRAPHELSRTADFSYLKSSTRSKRAFPTDEEQILDAPGVVDDYYLNLVDWSRSNVLAIGLENIVYLWNAEDGSVNELCQEEGAYVTSVSWGKNGAYLAVGNSKKELAIWDVQKPKRLRVMGGISGRIGSLSWRQHLVTSGGHDGSIRHHDVRAKKHVTEISAYHKMEICGLKWSRDGKYLVSGCSDHNASVWGFDHLREPMQVMEHAGAVKGLAWSPHHNSILATGAGSSDQHLRLWNVLDGTCQKAVKTGSAVTSIVWSKVNKELVTGHGDPSYQLRFWNEDLVKQADIEGHAGRILKLVRSPCGSLVASLSADETLRVWKCFDLPPDASKSCLDSFSMYSTIR